MEQLFDVHDVARILKLKPSTIYKYSMCSQLPCLKIAGSLRFVPEKIREYIEKQAKDSPEN